MARDGPRTSRPHTASTSGSRGGLRGSRLRPSSETGRHLGVQKTGKLRSLKNQIRGVQRLLEKPDLDPRARSKQAAVLDALNTALAQSQRTELERKYAVRYHKVRFFERVKLERQIKQLEKKLDTAGSDSTAAELARLRDDLQYVLHFPQGQKYVSIVKQADTAEAQALLDSERSRLRGLIAKQLTEAAMLAEPDEGNALRAAWAHAHTEGKANSNDAPDDFFLQEDDPEEEAAAMHEAQHAPTDIQTPALGPRKARVSGRGGLVQKQRSQISQHREVKDGKHHMQRRKGQQQRGSFPWQGELATAAQPGREEGVGQSRRAQTDTCVAEQPAAPDVAARATIPSVMEGVHRTVGGGHGVDRGPRPQRKHAAPPAAQLRPQFASSPGQLDGKAAAENEHAQKTQLRTRAQGGRKRKKKPSEGKG